MWGQIAGAVLGGLVGSQANQGSSTQSINLAPESEFEKRLKGLSSSQFEDIAKILGGQSVSDIQGMQGRVTEAQGGMDKLLQAFAQAGGRPTAEQVGQAQQYAGQVFQPEQVAMQQAFQDQEVQAQRAAASMGRSFGGDPILRAKLAQEQTRQQAQLGARQGSFAAQYAQQIPGQAIGAQEALMNLRSGIASQAMQNRLNLLNMGTQLQQQERQWRLGTASRTNSTSEGGGLAGAISGAIGGASMGAGLAGLFSGGAGAKAPIPTSGGQAGTSFGSDSQMGGAGLWGRNAAMSNAWQAPQAPMNPFADNDGGRGYINTQRQMQLFGGPNAHGVYSR